MKQLYVQVANDWQGPYSPSEIKQFFDDGSISGDTPITNESGEPVLSVRDFLKSQALTDSSANNADKEGHSAPSSTSSLQSPNPLESLFKSKEVRAQEFDDRSLETSVRRYLLDHGLVAQNFIGTITPEVAEKIIRKHKQKKWIRRTLMLLLLMGVGYSVWWFGRDYVENYEVYLNKALIALGVREPEESVQSEESVNSVEELTEENVTVAVDTTLNYRVRFSDSNAGRLRILGEGDKYSERPIEREYVYGKESPPEYAYELNPLWRIQEIKEEKNLNRKYHLIEIVVSKDTVHDIAQAKRKALLIARFPGMDQLSGTFRSLGSGFIAEFNDAYFLITNAHIFEGPKINADTIEFWEQKKTRKSDPFDVVEFMQQNRVSFQNIDGNEINPFAEDGVFISKQRDLVMVRLSENTLRIIFGTFPVPPETCFKILPNDRFNDTVKVEDEVFSMGNQAGLSVIRELSGKINAIGPMVVEASLNVKNGDSGSPLFHAKTESVIGITTYLLDRKKFFTRIDNESDWEIIDNINGINSFYRQLAELKKIEINTMAIKDLSQLKMSRIVELSDYFHYLRTMRVKISRIADKYSNNLNAAGGGRARMTEEINQVVSFSQKQLLASIYEDLEKDELLLGKYGYYADQVRNHASMRREMEQQLINSLSQANLLKFIEIGSIMQRSR